MTEAEAVAADMAERLRPATIAAIRSRAAESLSPVSPAPTNAQFAAAAEQTGITQPSVTVQRDPWLDLPSAGEPYIFMNAGSVLVPAIGATVVVVTYQVPRRRNGNIEWIANQFIGGQGVEGTGVISWRLLLDGIPAKGYDNIPATIGTMSNPADLRESPIRIFENQIVSLVLVNIAFVPNQQVLLGMLRGKFWPLEQEGQGTWV
jgi:hypothetical protein